MANIRALTPGQTWFVQRMQALSYNRFNLDKGICYGFSQALTQEILGGGSIDELNDLLYTIHDMPIKDIGQVVVEAHNKYSDIVRYATLAAYQKFNVNPKARMTDEIRQTARQYIHEKLTHYTALEKNHLKIRALFESIELLHMSHKHKEVFAGVWIQQFDLTSLNVMQSASIERKGGINNCATFSGIYNEQEVITYIQELQNYILNGINYPVSFLLSNFGHTINMSYIPGKGIVYIDANYLPAKIINDPKAIAKAILKSFRSNNVTAFSTHIFVTRDHAVDCQSRFKLLNQSPTWNALHDYKAKAKAEDDLQTTWLFMAVIHGHDDIVEALLKQGANPNHLNKDKFTPMYMAANFGRLKAIGSLVDYGGDINTFCVNRTALGIACVSDHYQIVDFLLQKRADPNMSGNLLAHPLVCAAENGNVSIVKNLMQSNVDLNKPGIVAAYMAAQNGCLEILKILIEANVNINRVVNQKTALYTACLFKHNHIVHLLLEKGADPNINDEFNYSPLHCAAANNNVEAITALIAANANINAVNKQGVTPFMLACVNKNLAAVKAFIANNADVNISDCYGVSPFFQAIYGNRIEIVKELIHSGLINLNAKRNGKSARQIAQEKGYIEILLEIDKALQSHTPTGNGDSVYDKNATFFKSENERYDELMEIKKHFDKSVRK